MFAVYSLHAHLCFWVVSKALGFNKQHFYVTILDYFIYLIIIT